MALRSLKNEPIQSLEDWISFFKDQLLFSQASSEKYANYLFVEGFTGEILESCIDDADIKDSIGMLMGEYKKLKSFIKSKVLPSQQSSPPSGSVLQKPPMDKVPRPQIGMEVTQLGFDQFKFEWTKYKEHLQLTPHEAATSLFFCCTEDVRSQLRILQTTDNSSWSEERLMLSVRDIVLSKTSPIVHIKQFMEIKQNGGETCQNFLRRLQAKASCCNFQCSSCKASTAESRVREKFILGLNDIVIQRSALKTESIAPGTSLSKLLTESITLEQSLREQQTIISSTNLTDHSEVYGVHDDNEIPGINTIRRKSKPKEKCHFCGLSGHSANERRTKCPAWGSKCENCGILNHNKYACLKPKPTTLKIPTKSVEFSEILTIGEISSINLQVSIKPASKGNFKTISVFPDTGANICLMGPSQLKAIGLKQSDLTPCTEEIAVAGGSTIKSTGWVKAEIKLADCVTEATVYFAKSAQRFFLSRSCCQDLRIISKNFPHPERNEDTKSVKSVESSRQIPQRPAVIPLEPTEDNIPGLKQYLLDSFAHSTFNKTPPFPKLSTPPATIHLKPDFVVPPPAFTPATVAEHWKEEVKAAIDRDVEAGILVKVPLNEPTEWCSRMIVVKKKDGRPRRTVDFQKLNKQCLREPNHSESPFHTARQIPSNTWKSVFDAVDGYHSVELDAKSSRLTTFMTNWGRYRYLRFPQGHCAAGDAFVGRVQQIMAQIPRMVRIVDDMCIFDESIESAFWHAWDVLTTCAKNGIVLNISKFQFCSKTIEFAGLKISSNGIQPSEKILKAIQDFPPPQDLTQARAFFGLLNQVQWAYANSSKMSPFRELVKPNSNFSWTKELRELFEEAKNKILKQVEEGVRQYDLTRDTCLQTDFSQNGLGYLLLQKYCTCSTANAPLCCTSGWKLVYAGSRFTKGAEKRYAPTEGEALAVAWALNHARVFTQGCKNLIIATDHRPLLGILNDRPFSDVKNPRILRLKEQTLQFDFTMKYTKGKWHRAPDALSRSPVVSMLSMFHEDEDLGTVDTDIQPEIAFSEISTGSAITFEKLSSATVLDSELSTLRETILAGFPKTQNETHPSIRQYFNIRDNLWIENDMVMFKNRIVVPKTLRHPILKFLLSAHQGTEGMRARASECVYWPGINAAINETRKNCKECCNISPSQAKQPIQQLPHSEYPFQQICVDECEIKGHHYFIVVDKFTNWLIVFHQSGHVQSKHVIESLTTVFETYGVAEQVFSDGGLPLVSSDVQDYLDRWGVKHNISSAHYPQSNGRAELAIKTAKRMLQNNIGRNGSLKTEAVCRALLQYRNTPIKNLGLSPAQLLFHRQLRDVLPARSTLLKPHKRWITAARNREKAFQQRDTAAKERYNTFSKNLDPLSVGSRVFIQDFQNRRRWNRSGRVVERDDRKYTICMDGSNRVVTRNRKFIKPYTLKQTADDILISTSVSLDSQQPPSPLHSQQPSPLLRSQQSSPLHSHQSSPLGTQQSSFSNSHQLSPTRSQRMITRSHQPLLHFPNEESQALPQDIPQQITESGRLLPRMLRALQPHNKPGLKE